jgi:diguanylate cyclase (GGDEF)-like protein
MMEPTSPPSASLPPDDPGRASDFGSYAQLVKMLVPSSGSIAIYDVHREPLWCSDGYERPDLRELLDSLQADGAEFDPSPGRVLETASGVTAYAATLQSGSVERLGFVVVELGSPGTPARADSIAPSLLRPVLECLAARISLERDSSADGNQRDDLELLLALDESEPEGGQSLQALIAHCVATLGCACGAFLVPERGLNVVANRSEAEAKQHSHLLDRTQKHLLAWARLNNRPMVVNRVGSNGTMAPYKILSCPARDPRSEVTGLLAFFREAEAPDFETRDIRILEYFGRKAITILASQHDALTGLANRARFERDVRKAFDSGPATEAQALLYVNIDRLNAINDAFGFKAGDEVIQRLAEVIRANVDAGGVACRLNGDRFAIFLPAAGVNRARELGESLTTAAANLGYMNAADAMPVSISVGLATRDRKNDDCAHVLAAAELACKRAQQAGGNRVELYAPAAAAEVHGEQQCSSADSLRRALENDEFRLQAQPIVDLFNDPGHILGYEVLVRMCDSAGALMSPEKFVATAERTGLMIAVDKWVVATTMAALQSHSARLNELSLGIALNVSASSFASADFADFVLNTIRSAGLPCELFCFELRESAAVANLRAAEAFIHSVTAAGCHVSLDDFGAGLSSLAHLKQLKVSYLKIDGGLIRRVVDDVYAESLVRGLAKAAQTLGVLTVAEHVENDAIATKLQELEIDLAQGYHYGRPAAFGEALAIPSGSATYQAVGQS